MDTAATTARGGKWTLLFLPLILAAALALRFPTLSAYPFQDEAVVEFNGLYMAAKGTVHPFSKNWPTLIYFLQLGSAQVLHWVGLGPAPVEALAQAANEGFTTAGPYLQMCRGLSALYALLALLFLLFLARRLTDGRCALWAVALLGAAPLHVAVSRLATTDVLCTALVLLTLWLAAEGYARRVGRWWLLSAALAAGVAAGAKYLGGMAVLAPVTVALFPRMGARARERVLLLPQLGLAALAGLVITVPGMVVAPGDYLAGLGRHAGDARAGWEFFRGVSLPGYLYHPLVTFSWSMGGSLAGLAGLAGLVVLWLRHRAARIVLAPFALAWFLVVGYTGVLYGRYWAPFLPMLCLGLAWGTGVLFRDRPLFAHLTLGLLLAWSLLGELPRALTMKGQDTRVEAVEQLAVRVPLGAKIATLYPLRAEPRVTAALMTRWQELDQAARLSLVREHPGALRHLLWDSAYPALDPRHHQLVPVSIKDGGQGVTLAELRRQGVTHYLWSAFRDGMVEQAGPQAFPRRHAFLVQLRQLCGKPELVIDPGGEESGLPLAEEETRGVWSAGADRPGPRLKLYALPRTP